MRRIIAWFVYNPVAANLLMIVLILGGLMSLFSIQQEEFPEIELDAVQISVSLSRCGARRSRIRRLPQD